MEEMSPQDVLRMLGIDPGTVRIVGVGEVPGPGEDQEPGSGVLKTREHIAHASRYALYKGAYEAMKALGLDADDTEARKEFQRAVPEEVWQRLGEHVAERVAELLEHEVRCCMTHFKAIHTGMSVHGDLDTVIEHLMTDQESEEDED